MRWLAAILVVLPVAALAQANPCATSDSGGGDLAMMRCALMVASQKIGRAAQVETDLETQIAILKAELAQQKALAGWWGAAGRALWPKPSEAAPAPKAE